MTLTTVKDSLRSKHQRPILVARTRNTCDNYMAVVRLSQEERLLRVSHFGKVNTPPITWTETITTDKSVLTIECIDATDFARQVLKGNTRWVPLLLGNESHTVLETHDWKRLQLIQHKLPLHKFVSANVNQANGLIRQVLGIAKRGKISSDSFSDEMKLASAASLLRQSLVVIQDRAPHFCTYRDSTIGDLEQPINMSGLSTEEAAVKMQQHVGIFMEISKKFKAETETCTDNGKHIMMEWLDSLDELSTTKEMVVEELGDMQRVNEILPALSENSLLSSRHAVHVVQCGSAMYGLATPTSDIDYHIVYVKPPSEILALDATMDKTIQQSVDATYGADKAGVVEYVAKELSQFVGALVKSHPNAVELLFLPTDKSTSSSWIWNELVDMRHMFVTSQCLQMYFGFVRDHLAKARKFAQAGDKRAFSKALYHTFHKLFELKRLLCHEDLHVTLKGTEHEFVYGIRTRPLTGHYSPTTLLELAQSMLDEMMLIRESRMEDLPEMVGAAAVTKWLHSVRVRLLAYERQ